MEMFAGAVGVLDEYAILTMQVRSTLSISLQLMLKNAGWMENQEWGVRSVENEEYGKYGV